MKTIILIVFVVVLAGIAVAWLMIPKGPFCQSCTMPMTSTELFGTEADGSAVNDYCGYCYQNGTFTEPDITMEEMIDKCVHNMVKQEIMPEEKARKLISRYLPHTKRWKAK